MYIHNPTLQITSNAEVLQEPAIKPTTWNVKNFVLAVKKKVTPIIIVTCTMSLYM